MVVVWCSQLEVFDALFRGGLPMASTYTATVTAFLRVQVSTVMNCLFVSMRIAMWLQSRLWPLFPNLRTLALVMFVRGWRLSTAGEGLGGALTLCYYLALLWDEVWDLLKVCHTADVIKMCADSLRQQIGGALVFQIDFFILWHNMAVRGLASPCSLAVLLSFLIRNNYVEGIIAP